MALTKEGVIAALTTIMGPKGTNIVTGGEVRALEVDGNSIRFVLEIDPSLNKEYLKIKETAESYLKKLGAKKVSIVLTADATKAVPPDLKPNRKSEPSASNTMKFSSRPAP